MADKINVGVRIPSVHPCDVNEVRHFVQAAESMGFHSIWAGDHLFHQVDVLHPLALLAWVAGFTTRVRLGTSVLLAAYQNPLFLAKMAATVDQLSGGRLTLGISLGGRETEYRSLGVPIRERVGRFREIVSLMRRLWSEEEVSYEGRYYQVEEARIKPQPLQRPSIPIWFGGSAEATLRRAIELADGWVGSASAIDAEQFRTAVKQLKAIASERGRDLKAFGFAKLILISIDDDRGKARELALAHWRGYYSPAFDIERTVIYGDPAECKAGLLEYTAAEASEITLILEPSSLDERQLELLKGIVEDASSP